MAQEKRYVADCRKVPDSNCTLTFAGTEKDVLEAAAQHAATKHGLQDTPKLREMIRAGLEEEHPVAAR